MALDGAEAIEKAGRPGRPAGAGLSVCRAQASSLRKLGFEVIELPFIEISRNMPRNGLYTFRLLANARKIGRLVRRRNIDIIQVNDLYNLAGIVAKRFARVKVITHVRRMPESFPLRLYGWWVKLHKKHADKILPVSEANARIFGNDLSAEQAGPKVEVFYDPMPQQKITFDYDPGDKPVFRLLYLANFTVGKGQNYALEALKLLYGKNPEIPVHIQFTGGDFGLEKNRAYRKSLEQQAAEYGITHLVSFTDGVSDVSEPISKADIMLNFSDSESLSRVSMEALYFGVPLIATDVGGTNEMVRDGWNGLLVERANVHQMAAAIARLITSEALRAQFSQNGKQHVAEHFAPDALSLQLEKMYSSLR
jgi:glycosyltransferase involved in cell wall biosynthesis